MNTKESEMAGSNSDGTEDVAPEQGGGEFRTSREIGHGYISGVTFTDKAVTFSWVGDQAIFEGDIVLNGRMTVIEEPGQEPPGLAEADVDLQTADEGIVLESAVVITGASHRWPDGIVPFEIDAGLPQAQSTAVQDALRHWRSKSRLAFPQRTQNDNDWIRFVSGSGCSSRVGRQGGRQDITLGIGCGTGQAIHEIGHSVGLWHEQSREDRDNFVTINWQNIDPAQRHNFDQHINDGDDVGEYDYGSIMHYPRDAFSINGQDTITPNQAGVTIGQRNGLSAFDTAGVRAIYPGLQSPTTLTWVGDFGGDGQHDLISYVPARMNWWLGTAPAGQLGLQDLGSTSGFGQVGDGRPFWIGRFSHPDRDEILFYYPGDDNWWLGGVNGGALAWNLVSNTKGFGHGINDGRPFWTGRFSRADRDEVLIYYPGDDNWWLGSHNGNTLQWSFAGNTAGFGHGINDGRPFWIGDFNGDNKSEVLIYYPGDDNWWLGSHNGNTLQWSFAGNTAGFGHGINDGRPFWTGRFSRADRDEVLIYYPGDDNWWLGSHNGNTLQWSFAGNTAGFGHGINDGRPFWIGDFNGDNKSEVLIYYPGDKNWWLGKHDGKALVWSLLGNTAGFGQIWDGRPFWTGRFAQRDRDNIVFYYPGDGKYWIATYNAGTFAWRMFGDF